MKIEDLRNIYTNSRVDLIELGGESIYYAEEKVEEGHNSLFLLEYNRRTKRERVVTNYILNDPLFRLSLGDPDGDGGRRERSVDSGAGEGERA